MTNNADIFESTPITTYTATQMKKKKKFGMKAKRTIADTIIYIVLSIMSVIWLFPYFWLLMQALRKEPGATSQSILPKNFTFDNFILLFTDQSYPFLRWFLNTLVVAIFTCIISTLLVLMVSYALSRLRFKARKKLMNVALIIGLFPSFMSMIAVYYMFAQFGLTNTLVGLTLAYSLAAGAGYYVVKGFFDTIPLAIDEAARIDGASRNRIFWQMIIPLSKPIIVNTALTTFLGPWCDFILVSVLMRGSDFNNFTVAVGLWEFLDKAHIDATFTRFCAGAVVVSVPIMVLFMSMQRFFVEGITGGAAKG